jgi:hypothetical protein
MFMFWAWLTQHPRHLSHWPLRPLRRVVETRWSKLVMYSRLMGEQDGLTGAIRSIATSTSMGISMIRLLHTGGD